MKMRWYDTAGLKRYAAAERIPAPKCLGCGKKRKLSREGVCRQCENGTAVTAGRTEQKTRKLILEPHELGEHTIRYSGCLRHWVVDELRYFKSKREAFGYVKALLEATRAKEERR
jgi:hypothetical protein